MERAVELEESFQLEEDETVELDCGKRSFRMEGQAMRREFKMERMRFYWMKGNVDRNAIGCVDVIQKIDKKWRECGAF